MKKLFKIISLMIVLTLSTSLLCSCSSLFDDLLGDEEDLAETVSMISQSNVNDSADQDVDANSYTLMIYMCGSDLESEDGAATADLNEILHGSLGNNLNVIVQTGGATKWQNNVVSARSVQRYLLTNNGMALLDDIGQTSMANPDVLGDFISYTANAYPADRYGLIMWNHGGGTLGGYGADENYDGAAMNLSEIATALSQGGCSFDFIGFDCCLMATIATAIAVSPYANYLLASEESEPGSGWYYTNFISLLDENPGVSMKELASTIIKDFTNERYTYLDQGVTLSLMDLSQTDTIMDKLYDYLSNSREYLQEGNYQHLATARSGARSYGENEYDQIDIIDYVSRTNVDGGSELISAIQNSIVLNAGNLAGSNGLAMYYPFTMPEEYSTVTEFTDDIGLDVNYYNAYFNDFVSVLAGGQYYGGGSSYPYSDATTSNSTTFEDYDWYNSDIANDYAENDAYTYVDSDELEITEKGDTYVLQLSDESWDLVTSIELQAYIDDGEGFLSLGSDNLYEFDDDGDLVVDFDYTWVHLNGMLVTYINMEVGELSDGTSYSLGCIPALLNEETDINIWVRWDNETGDYEILGYREDNDYSVASRGYRQFKDGDYIDFYFDYYDYDGNYDGAYLLEDNWIEYSSSESLEITYEDIGDVDTQICFWLQDIYGNDYWTEPLAFVIEE